MAGRDLVVIGGSAGALEALGRLMDSVPGSIRAALLIAIHRSAELPGGMPSVLARHTPLPVTYAVDGEMFRLGHVYVAPPDHHLLVSADRLRVTRGPREHGLRPAVDPLFRTAARAHGPRTVGVILSGVLDDGIEGLALVKRHGGMAIVQRPEDAAHDAMPAGALARIDVDHVLPADDVGLLLARIAIEPVLPVLLTRPRRDVTEGGDCALRGEPLPGALQPFVCPECGGALWQSVVAGTAHLQCHVGHGFTMRTLLALQDGKLEQALWAALRTLEEHAALRRRLASRARAGALTATAEAYEREAERSEQRGDTLRGILVEPDSVSSSRAEWDAAVSVPPANEA